MAKKKTWNEFLTHSGTAAVAVYQCYLHPLVIKPRDVNPLATTNSIKEIRQMPRKRKTCFDRKTNQNTFAKKDIAKPMHTNFQEVPRPIFLTPFHLVRFENILKQNYFKFPILNYQTNNLRGFRFNNTHNTKASRYRNPIKLTWNFSKSTQARPSLWLCHPYSMHTPPTLYECVY